MYILLMSRVLGSLISAVDPVSTISVFGRLNVNPSLFNIVFGESVLNDAVAIVLTRATERLATSEGQVGVGSLVAEFALVSFASLAIGVLVGIASALLHKHTKLREHPEMELATILCFAYMSYVLSEELGLSGIMSLLFTGILMGHYTFHSLSRTTKDSTRALFTMMAELCESFVFLYLGMAVFTYPSHDLKWGNALFTVTWCILGRAVTLFPLCFIINLGRKRKINWRQQIIMFLSGIRGAVVRISLSQMMERFSELDFPCLFI